MLDLSFYRNKRVFVTGHTGFKGSWLCHVLTLAGAEVFGYSLDIRSPSLYNILGLDGKMTSFIGDVRDIEYLQKCFLTAEPEIVFHLAAQPIVLEGYREPRHTFETNVMGTVNILEVLRKSSCVRSFLNVTTDKVYKNYEYDRGYLEDDRLGGIDPYSCSKSCSEMVTESYKSSFFDDGRVAISTARAGNVIGGGDFNFERIIPSCIDALSKKEVIEVRSPYSERPYQHVLESVFAYLLIAEKQYFDVKYADNYNVGPEKSISTGNLVELFCKSWGGDASWKIATSSEIRETNILSIDSGKLKSTFSWSPVFDTEDAVKLCIEWEKAYLSGGDVKAVTLRQIDEFINTCHWIK